MGSVFSSAAKDNSLMDSSPIPQIPDDLIIEILARLPVKFVVRSRCVCKSWNSLLSGNDFVKAHLTRYSANLNNGAMIIRCFPKSHNIKWPNIRLGGSVDGLVCVYHFDVRDYLKISSVGIWNPATNLYKDIPIPPTARSTKTPPYYHSFGIGFDPIANDYKVVYITAYPDQPFVAHVYSCNAGSWGKNSVKSTSLSRGKHYPSPTIVRGRPYWYNDHPHNYGRPYWYNEHPHNYYYVMFFDVQEEVFRFLPGIDFANKPEKKVMTNLRDSLAFMFCDYFTKTTSSMVVDVYIFDEICGLWTKNYTVGPIMTKYIHQLNCFPNGDLLLTLRDKFKLVSVDSETHAINMLEGDTYSYKGSRWGILGAQGTFAYVESLVSVDGMNIVYVEQVGVDILIVEKDL